MEKIPVAQATVHERDLVTRAYINLGRAFYRVMTGQHDPMYVTQDAVEDASWALTAYNDWLQELDIIWDSYRNASK